MTQYDHLIQKFMKTLVELLRPHHEIVLIESPNFKLSVVKFSTPISSHIVEESVKFLTYEILQLPGDKQLVATEVVNTLSHDRFNALLRKINMIQGISPTDTGSLATQSYTMDDIAKLIQLELEPEIAKISILAELKRDKTPSKDYTNEIIIVVLIIIIAITLGSITKAYLAYNRSAMTIKIEDQRKKDSNSLVDRIRRENNIE